MALPTKTNNMYGFANYNPETYDNGGKGSGNFGHAGRKGEVGGSAPKGSGGGSESDKSTKPKGETGPDTDYEAVAEATMLRDSTDPEYMSDKHKMLCDIADTLYNADIGPEYLKPEYKELYDEMGKDYWKKVMEDMSAIDSQLTSPSKEKELQEAYAERVKEGKGSSSEGGTIKPNQKSDGTMVDGKGATMPKGSYLDKDGKYHSAYEDKKSFDYDGDTFIVDSNKRGATTKDGKRSIMFPDETLYAREQMYKDYARKLKAGTLSQNDYNNLMSMAWATSRMVGMFSDSSHNKQAERLLENLSQLTSEAQRAMAGRPEKEI